MNRKYNLGVLLFEQFELLDVFGPLEMFGMYPETFKISMVGQFSGHVSSAQGPRSVIDEAFDQGKQYDILLVPGGQGTRKCVDNPVILTWLAEQFKTAELVTSVCTGSALLAKSSILDGVRATGNKMNFAWVKSQGPKTHWVSHARWIEDGSFFTSSGVSAGIDMSLAVIEKLMGRDAADKAALWAEYDWHRNSEWDPFAEAWGLD